MFETQVETLVVWWQSEIIFNIYFKWFYSSQNLRKNVGWIIFAHLAWDEMRLKKLTIQIKVFLEKTEASYIIKQFKYHSAKFLFAEEKRKRNLIYKNYEIRILFFISFIHSCFVCFSFLDSLHQLEVITNWIIDISLVVEKCAIHSENYVLIVY